MAEQGEGVVLYQEFGEVIDPAPQCPATLTGLKVKEATNLTGITVNLIINHKVQQGQTLAEIVSEPGLYFEVEPGHSLDPGSLQELFNSDLDFPIYHKLQAFLRFTGTGNPPQQVIVQIDWE